MTKGQVHATNRLAQARFAGACVSAVSWVRNGWCRVELLHVANQVNPRHLERLELVFPDAAEFDFDGVLDNRTELRRGTRFAGHRKRQVLPLSSGQLIILAASSHTVPLQRIITGRAGVGPPFRHRKFPTGSPRTVRVARTESNLDLRGFTIESLSFSLRGDCRLGVLRFKGRGSALRLEKFDLAFVRPIRLSGQVRFSEGPVEISRIRRLPLTGKLGRRRKIAQNLVRIDGCWEFAIRSDAGKLSIVAEDCILVPK